MVNPIYIVGRVRMINVIGLGYIGLPTALMLATHGKDVIGTDYNKGPPSKRKV